jgi:quinol monooxygenase YgiN
MTILVTGVIELDPAMRDEAIAAALVVMEATRAEEGCEGYTFSADFAEPGRFYVVEQWASEDAMNAHMGSAHLAEFMGKMGAFGVTKASLTRWDGAVGSKLM